MMTIEDFKFEVDYHVCKLRIFKNSIKHWFQRRLYGWSYDQTWAIDNALAEWILPILRRFKEDVDGYPYGLTEKEWDIAIDKMIRTFELMQNNYAAFDDLHMIYENKIEIKHTDTGMDIIHLPGYKAAKKKYDKELAKLEKEWQEGWDLFHKHIRNLGW